MRVSREKLEQLKKSGKATLVSKPAEPVAAPIVVAENPSKSPSKKKWRFDVERNWEGYITGVTATEI